jgi:transcriptional regulator with XRE-family HTH domain
MDRYTSGMTRNETFANRLRRLREERGLTIAALAASAKTTPRVLRYLESGRTKSPALLVGLRLARCLNVEADYLALGESSHAILLGITAALSRQLDAVDRKVNRLERARDKARRR